MSKVEKFNWTLFGSFMFGVIGLAANRSNNSDGQNNRVLFNALNLGDLFTANSQETISADYIFIN